MERLNLKHQEVLDEINLETTKMEKIFKEKELNELIKKTMKEQKLAFTPYYTGKTFNDNLINLAKKQLPYRTCCTSCLAHEMLENWREFVHYQELYRGRMYSSE